MANGLRTAFLQNKHECRFFFIRPIFLPDTLKRRIEIGGKLDSRIRSIFLEETLFYREIQKKVPSIENRFVLSFNNGI